MFTKKVVLIAMLFFTLKIAIADSLPNITLTDAKGGSISSETLLKEDKNTLLLFFRVCCYPSLAAIEDLNEIIEEDLEDMNVNVILISVDDSRNKNKVIPALKTRSNKYEFYYDTNSDFKRAMGVIDAPHYIFYNTKKIKIFERSGYIEDIENRLNEILESD